MTELIVLGFCEWDYFVAIAPRNDRNELLELNLSLRGEAVAISNLDKIAMR